MSYKINEGELQLPDASFFDGSINVIRFDKLNTSLVITRGWLQDGETLEKNFDTQVKKLEAQMKEVRFQGRHNLQVGKKSEIPAIEVRTQYKDGKNHVYQFQLLCELSHRRVMAMSYLKPSPLSEIEARQWEAIKAGIDYSNHQ